MWHPHSRCWMNPPCPPDEIRGIKEDKVKALCVDTKYRPCIKAKKCSDSTFMDVVDKYFNSSGVYKIKENKNCDKPSINGLFTGRMYELLKPFHCMDQTVHQQD